MGVGAAAAHCTGYQADLFLHPSSGLVSKPLAASLALTTQRASLLAGVLVAFLILIFSMQPGYRPPGAIFFLLRRRKNMERKTPRRAGGSPPYVPTPLGGGRWCGWLCFGYQADLRVHPCPDGRCADRLPLRCCLRSAVVTWALLFLGAEE